MNDSSNTFIKICGITRAADAAAAARAGAVAIGFVFAPSPRKITIGRAGAISRKLHPSVLRFGVFVDADPDLLAGAIDGAMLDGVQLQGSETADDIASLKGRWPELIVIKAVKPSADPAGVEGFGADIIMIDPKETARPEKSGEPVSMAVLRSFPAGKFIVAGGLTPGNVSELVKQIKPWGVDVSGGVEVEPGRKDPQKVQAFIRAVREAEAG